MQIRASAFAILALPVFILSSGCGKTDVPSNSRNHPELPSEAIVSIHWAGKKCLGTNAGAFYFMRLLGLPEVKKLQTQTLDKLSAAAFRSPEHGTNGPARLLPLLDDVLQEETYFEFGAETNHSSDVVFAIRLDGKRAGVWETNLTVIAASLGWTVANAKSRGLMWTNSETGKRVELARTGEWTVVGAGRDRNQRFEEVIARIEHDETPFFFIGTNWLQMELDLTRASTAFDLRNAFSNGLPQKISLSVSGDGGNVITRCEVSLAEPLPQSLEAWSIPTNLIHGPLASFTAVRGLSSWPGAAQVWNNLQLGLPPAQLYCWAPSDAPLEDFLAVPFPDATNRVRELTEKLLDTGNAWLAAHATGRFQRLNSGGAVLSGLPMIAPFVQSVDGTAGGFLVAGLAPSAGKETSPPPVEISQWPMNQTNLLCYHWELTGETIRSWLTWSQVARLALHRQQLPLESAGISCLGALVPRVGPSVTTVTNEGAGRLVIVRKSTVGLTGLELHLLVEWLESPEFPAADTFTEPLKR